jgi:hypothetical protein
MKTDKKLNCLIAGLVALYGIVRADTYIADDFKGTTATNWSFVTGQGAGSSLTAQTGVDPVGSGWLRLNNDTINQSSFVYNHKAIPTFAGVVFTFDFVMWGAGARLADGLALAIFRTNATPAAGAYGGSMGYAQKTGIPGLPGGLLGIGFDQYGNYSNPTEGRIGGPGKVTNSIAIRGLEENGYDYITGTGMLNDFSAANAVSRDAASIHTVRISITTDAKISVEWKDESEAEFTVLVDQYQTDLVLPDEIMFGYTAGTGNYSSNHEIRNLTVRSIPEPTTVLLLGLGGAVTWLFRFKQRY